MAIDMGCIRGIVNVGNFCAWNTLVIYGISPGLSDIYIYIYISIYIYIQFIYIIYIHNLYVYIYIYIYMLYNVIHIYIYIYICTVHIIYTYTIIHTYYIRLHTYNIRLHTYIYIYVGYKPFTNWDAHPSVSIQPVRGPPPEVTTEAQQSTESVLSWMVYI